MRKAKPSRHSYKIIRTCMIGAACIAGVLYVSGCWYFHAHFYPHTTAAGVDVGSMTAKRAEESVKNSLQQSYALDFQGRNGSEQMDTSKINLIIKDQTDYDKLIINQHCRKWPLEMFQDHEVPVSLSASYDEKLLTQEVHSLDMVSGKDVQDPVSASVKYEDGQGFVLVPETEGTRLDEKKVLASIKDAVTHADLSDRAIIINLSDDYVEPEVKSDNPDLQEEYKAVQNLGKTQLVMDFTDDILNLDMNRLASMIVMKDKKPDLDPDMLGAYVLDLAKQENTIHDIRSFITHDGDTVSVQSDNDSYGFVLDQEKTAEVIRDGFLFNASDTLEAVWNTGYCVPKARHTRQGDIGETYAEVSIDEQHMWYYQNGKCIFDCDVVTGCDGGRNTPQGVYFIWNKESPSRLQGSYGSQNVSYWMAVTWDGCGFHDASWRSSFGDDIWRTNGSHGCINMPPAKAAELYKLIDYNTPVVIYERTGQ